MPRAGAPAAEAPLDRLTADCRQRRVPLAGRQGAVVVVVETGTNSGDGAPAAKVASAALYITGMAAYLEDKAGPKYDVIAVCWFDTDTNDSYNWRVDQTAASWQAWLALARNPYFGGPGSLGRPGVFSKQVWERVPGPR